MPTDRRTFLLAAGAAALAASLPARADSLADIRKRGPGRLIIKRGEYGAVLFDSAGMFFVPGFFMPLLGRGCRGLFTASNHDQPHDEQCRQRTTD